MEKLHLWLESCHTRGVKLKCITCGNWLVVENGNTKYRTPWHCDCELKAKELRIKELVEGIELILPLAKGYVALSGVGSNQKYVDIANDLLGGGD